MDGLGDGLGDGTSDGCLAVGRMSCCFLLRYR